MFIFILIQNGRKRDINELSIIHTSFTFNGKFNHIKIQLLIRKIVFGIKKRSFLMNFF